MSGRAGVFVLFMIVVVAGFSYLYRKLSLRRDKIYAWFEGVPSSPFVRKFKQRHPAFFEFIAQRLSPASYLGLHLTVGLSASIIFVWIFGGITEDILTGDPFVAVDQWVVGEILYFKSPLASNAMQAITQLGGTTVLSLSSLAVIAYLVLKRHFDKAIGFSVALVGGSLLVSILKIAFHRPRPINESSLILVSGWSFPSGHAMMSVIFYGMVTYLLLQTVYSWRLRSFFLVLAGFIVFLIGFSRIYLQVHYLSDVVAGFAGGLFWLSICITGLVIYTIKKHSSLN